MKHYAIMQEAGPQAKRRAGTYGYARPKRRSIVSAPSAKEALNRFVTGYYLPPGGHKQYVGHELRWRSSWQAKRTKPDDGTDNRGREWEAHVTLRNGRVEHTVVLYAWKQSSLS